ncbi:MAG: lipase family protein, partial [Chloroflexota bacterium]
MKRHVLDSVGRAEQPDQASRPPSRGSTGPALFIVLLLLLGTPAATWAVAARLAPPQASPPLAPDGVGATAVPPSPSPFPSMVSATVTPSPAPSPSPTPDTRGTILERRLLETAQPAQITQLNARFYPPGTVLPPRHAVERHLIRYLSTDETGASLEIVAQLFVPQVAPGATLPVLVYGAGTTGLGDHCAVSREEPTVRNWGDYLVHMRSYASQGYIAILPDYAGFNDDSQLQRYFVAESESRVLLDAARAVFQFFEASPGRVAPEPAVFFAGYSQGGHAAFAVRDAAPSYAPELPVKGAIGHGASTDVTALLRDSPYFAPYVLYSFADYYGADAVDLSRLFAPRWLPTLAADVTSKCIDAMPGYYGTNPQVLYHPAFREALFGGRLEEAFPALKQVLDRNSTGLAPSNV